MYVALKVIEKQIDVWNLSWRAIKRVEVKWYHQPPAPLLPTRPITFLCASAEMGAKRWGQVPSLSPFHVLSRFLCPDREQADRGESSIIVSRRSEKVRDRGHSSTTDTTPSLSLPPSSRLRHFLHRSPRRVTITPQILKDSTYSCSIFPYSAVIAHT